MPIRARGLAAVLLGLTTTASAIPVFLEDGAHIGTQFAGYSLRNPETTLNKTVYGITGNWQFGLTPVFGLFSNLFDAKNPYLDIGGFQMTDNLNVTGQFGVSYPLSFLLGFSGDYGLAYRFGHGDFAPSLSTNIRAVANQGVGELTAVLGLEVYSFMFRIGPNLMEAHLPLGREKGDRTWLYFNYHKITDDDDGERSPGMMFHSGLTMEWDVSDF